MIDMALLENCVREDLNETAPRVMAVLRPLKVVIDNYPADRIEAFDCPYHPQKPEMGARKVPFSRELYIEQEDFMETPPKKYFRLSPGREVRLRYGYFITCVGVVKDPATGEVVEVHCTYDPETRSGFAPDGRKVNATIHWVSAPHAVAAEVRLYDRLFLVPDPLAGEAEFTAHLNPKSLEVLTGCRLEPSLAAAAPGSRYQFERLGYFCADAADSSERGPVFNRTVTLRDSWAKAAGKGK
jgi:glutaminyl-tRNA synthetase